MEKSPAQKVFERMEDFKKGFSIKCYRCDTQKYAPRMPHKISSPTMTMAIQPYLHNLGWRTIDRCFVCPSCLTSVEKTTDYTRPWYDKVHEQYKAVWIEPISDNDKH